MGPQRTEGPAGQEQEGAEGTTGQEQEYAKGLAGQEQESAKGIAGQEQQGAEGTASQEGEGAKRPAEPEQEGTEVPLLMAAAREVSRQTLLGRLESEQLTRTVCPLLPFLRMNTQSVPLWDPS